jgi:hypothetical protein
LLHTLLLLLQLLHPLRLLLLLLRPLRLPLHLLHSALLSLLLRLLLATGNKVARFCRWRTPLLGSRVLPHSQ